MLRYSYLLVDHQPCSLFAGDSTARLYEERALLFATSGDFVFTQDTIDQDYIFDLENLSTSFIGVTYYTAGRNDKGLTYSIIAGRAAFREKYMHDEGAFCLRSYIPNHEVITLAKELSINSVLGSRFYCENYKKSDLVILSKILGVPIPASLYISDFNNQYPTAYGFLLRYKQIIAKPDTSLGGLGIQCIDTMKQLALYANKNRCFLIQERLFADAEGSIQFTRHNNQIVPFVCETFQEDFRFSGFVYKKGLFSGYPLNEFASKIISFIENKYESDTDWFGIDFMIVGREVYFHDFNPRKTSVSYVLNFVNRVYSDSLYDDSLCVTCIYMYIKHISSYREIKTILKNSGLDINKKNGNGVFLINPALLNSHIAQFVVCTKEDQIDMCLEKISRVLKGI